jgi:hypothetical protein
MAQNEVTLQHVREFFAPEGTDPKDSTSTFAAEWRRLLPHEKAEIKAMVAAEKGLKA